MSEHEAFGDRVVDVLRERRQTQNAADVRCVRLVDWHRSGERATAGAGEDDRCPADDALALANVDREVAGRWCAQRHLQKLPETLR